MTIREMAESKMGKLVIACAVIGLALVLGIGLVSCSGIASVGGIGANQAVADAAGGVVEDVGLLEAETEPIGQEEDDGAEAEKAESVPSAEATGHDDEEASSQGSTEDPQLQGSAVRSKDNSTAPPQNTSQKTWVKETERVWVVDREAWTESVPIYGTIEISVCNICGTDITGNTSAHAKAHMKAGGGSGHHSEVRREITGYDTVSHPEEGHWETKVVGGHWE